MWCHLSSNSLEVPDAVAPPPLVRCFGARRASRSHRLGGRRRSGPNHLHLGICPVGPCSALLAAESLRSASRISGVMGLAAAAARNCANRASLTNFSSFLHGTGRPGRPEAVAATAFNKEQPRAYQGAVLL